MEIVNNKRLFRFELNGAGDEPATLEYRWLKGAMVLMRTWVPMDLRKKGLGRLLVQQVLEYAKRENLKIIVYCPFIEKYIKEHREYEVLLEEGHGI